MTEHESQHLEYKRELSDGLGREVVAFLNHRDGGRILIGVDDVGAVVGLSQDDFFEGYSMPRNKELMRIFRDLEMVEYLGSGIPRILRAYSKETFRFTENFTRMCFVSAEPDIGSEKQAAPQATPQVECLLKVLSKPLSMAEILDAVGKSDRRNVRLNYVQAAIDIGLVERTIPEKPKSPLQKYRLTSLGAVARKELG